MAAVAAPRTGRRAEGSGRPGLPRPRPVAPPGRRRPPARAASAVYVHWPFCASKCPYCDFNSHVRHGGVDEPRFAAALVRELETAADRTERRRPDSVFFGGGTPSLMSPVTVGAVLDAVDRLWGLDAAAEVTLEANPTSVEAGRFAGYRAAGVGRVSLGVQALDDAALASLGPPPHGRGGTAGRRAGAGDLPARFLRPDLRPPRHDRRGVGGGARRALRSAPTTCRSTSSPSRRARRSPRCIPPASCTFPTTTPPPISTS
jgi:hypothetical protein